MPSKGLLASRLKNTPYVVVLCNSNPTIYGGRFSKFGFVAVFRTGNDGRIDENISVSYKWDFAKKRLISKKRIITNPVKNCDAISKDKENLLERFGNIIIILIIMIRIIIRIYAVVYSLSKTSCKISGNVTLF